ncbi:hypothetical protein PCASD_06928 [Puccinia coronata f. sp. avenae]|uniref:Uncharacterized protein n=1 Tax=Puccinia coronata f. sp. avenae TaxID=200324 RepID=A0A2N5V4V3_9BASI|nr:hypothetical protein PCASD_06928 [Puccinia coronata f. sp. avenae]
MGSILKQRIIEGYASDGFCQSLKAVLPLRDSCFKRERLLYVDNRLLVPRSKDLLHQLITHKGPNHRTNRQDADPDDPPNPPLQLGD